MHQCESPINSSPTLLLGLLCSDGRDKWTCPHWPPLKQCTLVQTEWTIDTCMSKGAWAAFIMLLGRMGTCEWDVKLCLYLRACSWKELYPLVITRNPDKAAPKSLGLPLCPPQLSLHMILSSLPCSCTGGITNNIDNRSRKKGNSAEEVIQKSLQTQDQFFKVWWASCCLCCNCSFCFCSLVAASLPVVPAPAYVAAFLLPDLVHHRLAHCCSTTYWIMHGQPCVTAGLKPAVRRARGGPVAIVRAR